MTEGGDAVVDAAEILLKIVGLFKATVERMS